MPFIQAIISNGWKKLPFEYVRPIRTFHEIQETNDGNSLTGFDDHAKLGNWSSYVPW